MPLPEKPKVRYVDVIPVKNRGETALVLRDPLGVAEHMIALPVDVLELVALFDGKKTIHEVQAEWARQTHVLVPTERIAALLGALDENLYLEGERFEKARKDMVDRFRGLRTRPAALAGGAYPPEPEELRRFLGDFFTRKGGPGKIPGPETPREEDGDLVAIVAPHIDYHRGNTAYAHAFDAVARAGGADLYVIFGTAHQGGDDLYIFTKKPFETPLGAVETDVAFIERLERRLGGRELDRAEISHRTEHSVEFEAVFLKYVEERLGRRERPRIVPFICNSFAEWTGSGESPARAKPVAGTIEALRAEIAEEQARGTRVICIAGADLAHIGPKFGNTRPADRAFAKECEAKDREALERAVRVDGEGFFDYIAREKDERNICGLPCMYTMLKVLEGGAKRGEVLAYGQAPDPMPGNLVSFASVAYHRGPA